MPTRLPSTSTRMVSARLRPSTMPSAPSTQLIGAMLAPAQIQNWCIAVDSRCDSGTGSSACCWSARSGAAAVDMSMSLRSMGSAGSGGVLDADVLVPELRLSGDELRHQVDALGQVEDHDVDTVRAQPVLARLEGAVLADDDARDAV